MNFEKYLNSEFATCVKRHLNESTLSRVWKMVTQHESGTITAFRYASDCNKGSIYTKSQNKSRNSILKAKLLVLGYSVTNINGVYIENYKSDDEKRVKEESFIVIDINDTGHLERDLKLLGAEFEQDSITFSKPTGEYYLIGTNKCEGGYPGWNKKIKLGKPMFGKKGDFYSSVKGRPFVFESCENTLEKLTDHGPTEIRSIKLLSEKSINGEKL